MCQKMSRLIYLVPHLIFFACTANTQQDDTNNDDSHSTTSTKCTGAASIEQISDDAIDLSTFHKNDLYSPENLHEIKIIMTDEDWNQLQETAKQEIYFPAKIEFGGHQFAGAAVRYKGSWNTLESCVDDQGKFLCSRLSLKIKFNEYDPCGQFVGLRSLTLNSSIQDPSRMKERYAYHVLRSLNLPAGRANHLKVRLPKKNVSIVYVNVETVDHEYLEDRFSNPDGNLYKQVWPETDSEDTYINGLENNKKNPDVSRMLALAQLLSQSSTTTLQTELLSRINIDSMAKMLAALEVIGHNDGPMRFICYTPDYCINNNYYFYEEPKGRITFLPWDLDNTFWRVTTSLVDWFHPPSDCSPAPLCTVEKIDPCWEGSENDLVLPPACDPLNRQVVELGTTAYQDTLEQLVQILKDGPALLEKWQLQIQASIEQDPSTSSIEEFNEYSSALRSRVSEQSDAIKNLLQGP